MWRAIQTNDDLVSASRKAKCGCGGWCAYFRLSNILIRIELHLGPGRNSVPRRAQQINTGCTGPPTLLHHQSTSSQPRLPSATAMALLESFKQTIPPASIVDEPLTPPSTADAKLSTCVAAILRVFKSCQNGHPPSGPWIVYKLYSGEYEDLQYRLKDDVKLRGYVDDRVR